MIGLMQPFTGTKQVLIDRIVDWKYDSVHGPTCNHLNDKGSPDIQWSASADWRWGRCRQCHRQVALSDRAKGAKYVFPVKLENYVTSRGQGRQSSM